MEPDPPFLASSDFLTFFFPTICFLLCVLAFPKDPVILQILRSYYFTTVVAKHTTVVKHYGRVSPCFPLEKKLASRWEGVRLPRASGKFPGFPGSSPDFPGSFSATSPEVLSLWNSTVTRGSPEVCQTSPEVPRTSPEVPRTSPEVSPFLWEA